MARLASLTFEGVDAAAEGWTIFSNAIPFEPLAAITGSNGGRATGWATSQSQSHYFDLGSTSTAHHVFIRLPFRINTAPGGTLRIFDVTTSARTTFPMFGNLSASRTLDFRTPAGSIGVSAALALNTWYVFLIEIDGSLGDGSEVVRLHIYGDANNLIETIELTTGTISNGWSRFEFGSNLGVTSTTTGSFDFDLIAINDTSGGSENSFPDPNIFGGGGGGGNRRRRQLLCGRR